MLDNVGQYGDPADLRRDAQALAAATRHIITGYNSTEYLAKQQAGMRHDMSWDLPAQEWEQVCSIDTNQSHLHGAQPTGAVMMQSTF